MLTFVPFYLYSGTAGVAQSLSVDPVMGVCSRIGDRKGDKLD